MAIFDSERDAVVLRIVYDGPPRAGKTTSVRALARSLRRSVETPLEAAGRTLFFDWMEYTGGLFEGHQIRCQIVSVPGQPNLAPRRRALLLEADAVVFVADTGDGAAVDRSRDYITSMARLLRAEADPPIGVVVQANKRDLPDAVLVGELRRVMGDAVAGVAITESVASEGEGVRETFVFAVRLALDRVRELTARGNLPKGRPLVDNAEELLKSLEAHGAKSIPPSDVDPPPIPVVARGVNGTPPPALPDARVPSGAIWPPVDGRLVLHEATAHEQRARRAHSGDWVAGIGTGWRIQSPKAAAFMELEDGRHALLRWARVHAALAGTLSPNRCVVLAESGDGGWRLWQIVKVTSSLRERLDDLAREASAQALLDALLFATRALGEAVPMASRHGLVASLDTIDVTDRGAQFVGLMPHVSAEPSHVARIGDLEAGVVEEVTRLLRRDIPERLPEICAAVRGGWFLAQSDPWAARLVASLLETS